MEKFDPINLAISAGIEFDVNNIIYTTTNENLTEIFNHYNVKDKDVLTVLASSDQALTCFYKGAKSIDTFDRSYLTLYYYYLRKWLILYKKRFYPSYMFFEKGDIKLYDLIRSIKPKDEKEEEAQIFWKKYVEINHYRANQIFENRYVTGERPYNNVKEVKGFYDKPVNFYHIDMKEPITINKKYDVLILSNMLEYVDVAVNRDVVRKNIESLLNDNGIAILTYKTIANSDKWHQEEVEELTKGDLVLDNDYKFYNPTYGEEKDLAYSYKKVAH